MDLKSDHGIIMFTINAQETLFICGPNSCFKDLYFREVSPSSHRHRGDEGNSSSRTAEQDRHREHSKVYKIFYICIAVLKYGMCYL